MLRRLLIIENRNTVMTPSCRVTSVQLSLILSFFLAGTLVASYIPWPTQNDRSINV